MTEQEYRTQLDALEAQKADIDTQIEALNAAYTATVNEYPCWLYHETKGAVVVNSKEEADALGAGWSTSPAPPPEAAAKKKSESKEPEPKAPEPKTPDAAHEKSSRMR